MAGPLFSPNGGDGVLERDLERDLAPRLNLSSASRLSYALSLSLAPYPAGKQQHLSGCYCVPFDRE